MRTSYFPSTDSSLLAFAANLVARLSAAPQDYGVSPQQAADLAARQQALAAAQARVSEPATRTRPNIADRNDAREAFKAEARRIVSIIKGQPDVTDAQRLALGLKARNTTRTR